MEKTKACRAGLVTQLPDIRFGKKLLLLLLALVVLPVRANISDWQLSLEMPEGQLWQGEAASFLLISMSPPDDDLSLIIPDSTDFIITPGTPVKLEKDGEQGVGYPLRLTPIKSGVLTLPALRFQGYERKQIAAQMLPVSAPLITDEMSLNVRRNKNDVYLGQSVNVRFEWVSEIHPKALKAVNIVIPELEQRSIKSREAVVDDEFDNSELIGLPVGNRRVLSRWTKTDDNRVRFYFEYVIQPQHPGVYQLPAPVLLASVDRNSLAYRRKDFKGMRFSSHFNNNFFDEVRESRRERFERIMAKAEPFQLRVKALPEGAPSHFVGMVGRPEISVGSDVSNVRVGEPVQLEFRIRHPDLEFAGLPAIKNNEAFKRVFDIPLGADPASFEDDAKLIRQTLFAQSIEVTQIPQLAINYFDPDTGLYRDVLTDALPIKVIAGPQYSFSDSLLPDGAKLNQLVTPDRSGIWAHRWGSELVNPPELVARGMPWYYQIFLVIPPLLCLLLLLRTGFTKWRTVKNQKDIIQFRQSVLAGADPLVQLGIYLHKRVGLSPSRFSQDNILKALTEHDVNSDLVTSLCDWVGSYQARYASGEAQQQPADTAELLKLVNALEKELPTNHSSDRSGYQNEVRV